MAVQLGKLDYKSEDGRSLYLWQCAVCGGTFESKRSERVKYCSIPCRQEGIHGIPRNMPDMKKIKYATITVARNEESLIGSVLKCLTKQSIKPSHIVVVDDGSKDNTSNITKSFIKNHSNIKLLRRRDRGYSALGTYLMADVYNTGMKYLFSKNDWDFLIIVSSDTFLSNKYAEIMIKNMGDEYGAASGECGHAILSKDACYGAGRVIRRDVLEAIGGFPRLYSWEEGCLFYSLLKGLKTGHFNNASFSSRLPDAKRERDYIGWGRGIKDGGIHIIHLFYLVMAKIIFERRLIIAMKFLVGYFAQPYPKGYDWIDYKRKSEIKTIKHGIKKRMLKILL